MTAVVFATLVWKVVDFIRLLANFRTNASKIAMQLVAWIVGTGFVWLGGHAAVAQNVTIQGVDRPLHGLDFASIVLVGMIVASFAGGLYDLKRAIDSSDSAAQPALLDAIKRRQV